MDQKRCAQRCRATGFRVPQIGNKSNVYQQEKAILVWVPLESRTWSESLRFVMFLRTRPGGSAGEEPACDAGDMGLIPGLGRSPGEGKGYPLQYSGLESPMGCIPWGHKESDTTERLSLSLRTRIPGRQEGGREEANRGCTVSCHLLSPSGAEQVCSQNRDLLIADRNAARRGNMNSVSPAPTEPRYGGPSTDGSPLILKDRTPAPPWAGVVTSFPYAWHCPRERMPVCLTSRPSFLSSFISWSLGSLLNEVIGVS